MFSRVPYLVYKLRWIPFQSYYEMITGNYNRGISIGLNILLFMPLGYMLADNLPKKRVFLLCLSLSLLIELIQFKTGLGICEFDDLISNSIGAIVGIMANSYYGKIALIRKYRYIWNIMFLIAGLAGCIISSSNKVSMVYETQFDFDVDNLKTEGNDILFSGICKIYGRESLEYNILLIGEKDKYFAKTDLSGDEYRAKVDDIPGGEYEIGIQFKGFKPISTKTYIENGLIKYVKEAPAPEIEGTDIEFMIENGTLKAYEPKYDAFIYQVDKKLYWLIGEKFDASLIYHLYTDKTEKLPKNRIQYGFDNRSFGIGSKKEVTDMYNCGKYRVFIDIIPEEYYVTAIMVGMNKGSELFWEQYFRVNRFKK